MKYPNHEDYTKLYGRYLKKGPERFFIKSDPNGKRVLDLCCGGGQLSTYALEHGATFVQMVDSCREMLNPNFNLQQESVSHKCMSVESYLNDCGEEQYDIIVCRQAINYWFKNVNGSDIAKITKKGGLFVFNTFGNKPSETPTVRDYYHKGRAYKEISYIVDDVIHHVQTTTGFPPHVTNFNWISAEEYRRKLSTYFIIHELTDGPSSMWYCVKI